MKKARVLIKFLILLQVSGCIGVKGKEKTGNFFLLFGGGAASGQKASGVSQTSPGADGSSAIPISGPEQTAPSSSSGSGSGFIDGFVDAVGSVFSPVNNSQIRVRIFDEPFSSPGTEKGLLNIHLEYDFLESVFYKVQELGAEIPPADSFVLELEKIELNGTQTLTRIPSPVESRVMFRKESHFAALVRGLVLNEGSFTGATLYFKKSGKLFFKDTEYELVLENPVLALSSSFTVQKGKATSVGFQTRKEFNDRNASLSKEFSRSLNTRINSNDFIYSQTSVKQRLLFDLVPLEVNVHDMPSGFSLHVNSLVTVTKSGSALLLNRTPTEFSLFDLKNGFVGLAAWNTVQADEFDFLDITLGRNHFITVSGTPAPVVLEERSQNSFRFYGNLKTDKNGILDYFIDIDPTRSLFFTGRGFVFDPFPILRSSSQRTEDEDSRLADSIGRFQNPVSSEAELILRVKVSGTNSLAAPNAKGTNLIYTDVSFDLVRELKGTKPADLNSIRVPGGEVNGLKLRVTSMPVFTQGEECILFLKKYGTDWGTVRGELGKVSL